VGVTVGCLVETLVGDCVGIGVEPLLKGRDGILVGTFVRI